MPDRKTGAGWVARRGWTRHKRQVFLASLAATANVTKAADAAGISRTAAYALRARDAVFAQAWADAMDQALDAIEAMILERAAQGVEKTVFYGGKACGTIREYSDALAKFVLRSRRPERYGDVVRRGDARPVARHSSAEARAWIEQRLNQLAERASPAREDTDKHEC